MPCSNNRNQTLLPFSMRARSQTATSAANRLNSRTLVSSSVVHLFRISSSVLPLSMDGGGIATTGPAVLDVVVAIGENATVLSHANFSSKCKLTKKSTLGLFFSMPEHP